MYKYVQKAEGESEGENEGLVLKEVSFQGLFESIWCGCFTEREGGRVFQETAAEEEKARELTVDSLVRGICKVRVSEAERRVQEDM